MKVLFIFMFVIIFSLSYLSSQTFEISKVSELAYNQDSTGHDCIQIIDNILYYTSRNGLEIYTISDNGHIERVSMLTIPASSTMITKDQYCYLVAGGYQYSPIPSYFITVYKIDVSDIYNPIILDQIDYEDLNFSLYLDDFGETFMSSWVYNSGCNFKFYDYENMELIGHVITENYRIIVNDSLLVNQFGNIKYIERYNPPTELEVIGSIDVSPYSDDDSVYYHFKVVNDTILSAVNSRNITFWNFSDVTDWQYISRYTLPEDSGMLGNKQYVITEEYAIIFDGGLIKLIDISDIFNPTLLDSIAHNMWFWGQACDIYENNIYVGTVNDGIQHYIINDNQLSYVTSYYDYKRFLSGYLYDDKLITKVLEEGYYLFDIEDPFNHTDLGLWFEDKQLQTLNSAGNWMVLKNYENLSFEIYDITNIESPSLINTMYWDDLYEWSTFFCRVDEYNPDILYIFNYNSNFRKYDISETGNPILLIEYELPSIPNSLVVINSNIYFTESSSENSYNLHIISGLDINEPYQANEIPNFTSNEYLNSQCGFLVTHNLNYNSVAQIFQLDNPLNPELYFTPTWGERIEIKENLVFAIADFIIGVYELGASSSEPLAVFNGLSYTYNIHLTEHEGTNYLITNEMNSIGLFEYTYSPSSADDEILENKIVLNNYPNPFNPETIIEF
ncbi:MAG: hypothetical protein APR54_02135 [Candidatus Cloacimonas sp. SDB]|nr:MAG: hypothetical protein APR54_02135 [Candidatus Cloacimonas sp. SDB]